MTYITAKPIVVQESGISLTEFLFYPITNAIRVSAHKEVSVTLLEGRYRPIGDTLPQISWVRHLPIAWLNG